MRFVKTAESIWNIPAGFQRVEYLQSSGGAYIDTGYVFQSLNHSTTITFKGLAAGSGGQPYHIFGSNKDNNRSGALSGISGNNNYIGIGIGGHGSGSSTERVATPTTPKTMTVVSKSTNKFDWIVDGTKVYSDVSFTGSSLSGISEYIFGINFTSDLTASTTVYHYKAEDNGVVVRDMIPCIDPLGVPCMYDLVGKKPYYNQGTGTFTVGRQVIPVEYLESTGTQYIDTGFIPTNSTETEITFDILSKLSANYPAPIYSGNSYDASNTYGFSYNSYSNSFFVYRGSRVNITLARSQITTNKIYKVSLSTTTATCVDLSTSATYTVDITGTYIAGSRSLYMFRGNSNTTDLTGIANMRVYSCKIWDNGTLARDFIPCKDENNVGFMFDKVSGTCYLNAGTGAFIVGQNKYNMKLRLIRDNILPTGYTQLEYIESTGPQYIDTGIVMKSTNKIECRFQALSATTGNQRNYIFGADTVATGVQYSYSSSTFFGVAGRYQQNDVLAMNTDIHLAEVYDGKIYLDGVSLTLDKGTGANPYTSTKTIHLFGFNDTNGHTNPTVNDRVYYYKMWDNNVLIQDLIPAIDPSGTPCMYDLVSRTPFYNAGTGTFTTGKPVLPIVRFPVDPVPVGYKTVNYLQSSGTQYIDTGYKPNTNTRTVGRVRFNSFVGLNADYVFGVFSSPNNYGFNVGSAREYFNVPWGSNSGIQLNGLVPQLNTDYDFDISKTGYLIDGQSYGNVSTSSVNSTRNMYLFWSNGTSASGMNGRIYYLQIYDNNTLVRNFIPVIRLLDNKAGMWDTVTKQFYTTPVGDFITG